MFDSLSLSDSQYQGSSKHPQVDNVSKLNTTKLASLDPYKLRLREFDYGVKVVYLPHKYPFPSNAK